MNTADITIQAKKINVRPDGTNSVVLEIKEAQCWAYSDESEFIKTFSDATIIEEISRRYDIDLIINQIK